MIFTIFVQSLYNYKQYLLNISQYLHNVCKIFTLILQYICSMLWISFIIFVQELYNILAIFTLISKNAMKVVEKKDMSNIFFFTNLCVLYRKRVKLGIKPGKSCNVNYKSSPTVLYFVTQWANIWNISEPKHLSFLVKAK